MSEGVRTEDFVEEKAIEPDWNKVMLKASRKGDVQGVKEALDSGSKEFYFSNISVRNDLTSTQTCAHLSI